MSNEITMNVGFSMSSGNYSVSEPASSTRFNQLTPGGGGPGLVAISTGEHQQISFGDITPGFILMRNMDTGNYVNYGNVSGNLDFKLRPNKGPGLIELDSGGQLWMVANTSGCNVYISSLNI